MAIGPHPAACGLARLIHRAPFTLLLVAAIARAGGLSPEEAKKHFKVADGFEVQLFAGEPLVRQPVSITFDDRGRMWVVQYIEYPNPAGLKAVESDIYLRTKYDRVPEPPPKGPRGMDKITILDDTDGDGRADKVKDFVTGLNIASALAVGSGGAYVGNAPYLLFYSDRNADDVPDGDPEVVLSGFGLEDTHAVVNSIQWGPDGWLYGAQGSTCTAKINGIEFQQGIWRYHPATKRFELFAEGGGNTWGVDFDRHGNLIAGTNFAQKVALHQVQGGYYLKAFGKHGPLHNPHTFGYFDHAPNEGWRGGHVTCGGVLYEGGLFPPRFAHQYFAANPLANAVYWHSLLPDGSTFKTRFGGELLTTDDIWFRPVDCLVGPDGALYVADWYDQRIDHVNPVDNWDRTSGRIWRIAPRGAKPAAKTPLSKLTSDKLVDLLADPNDWNVRTARRLLAERRDPAVLPRLQAIINEPCAPLALEALWALYATGGWNEALAAELLDHPSADVRFWTVRLLGDESKVSPAIQAKLMALAKKESVPAVRSQLASTCKRLPGPQSLPIVEELLRRDEDASDSFIPLLLWWAIEDKATSDREQLLAMFLGGDLWKHKIVAQVVAGRVARRYLAEASDAGYSACARLLAAAPDAAAVLALAAGMEAELVDHPLDKTPHSLRSPLEKLWNEHGADPTVIRLAMWLASAEAYDRGLAWAADSKQPQAIRIRLIDAVGRAGRSDAVPQLLALVSPSEPEPIRRAALDALARFSDDAIAGGVLDCYPQMSPQLQAQTLGMLTSRRGWSLALVRAVDSGRIDPAGVPLDRVRAMMQHNDPAIVKIVERRWGKVAPATPRELEYQTRALVHTLNYGGKGDQTNGRALYVKHCGICHTLFGEGNKIGPDLTAVDRRKADWLVANIVNPNSAIRPEFVSQTVVTKNGRVETGLLAESTAQSVTLVTAKNERITLARGEIETLDASKASLMPEKLLDALSPQELRDLFSYLQSNLPPAAKPDRPEKRASR